MDTSHHTNSVPHTPLTVTNVSEQANHDNGLKPKELKKEDLSPTPKKMPAKIIFPMDDAIKKEAAKKPIGNSKVPTLSDSLNDEGFQEFLQKVAMVQQQEAYMQAIAHAHAVNHTPPSPQPHRRNFAMLPEYARYQEARFHRVISRCNSYSNLNNMSPSASPRVSMSPRVEWVPNPVAVQRAWDEHTLVARHAFPTSIFFGGGNGYGNSYEEMGVPPPVPTMSELMSQPNANASGLSDGGVSSNDYFRRAHSMGSDGGNGSIPSAAALSGGGSSSWSDEEENPHAAGARQFLAYLGGNSARNAAIQRQQNRRNSDSSKESTSTSSSTTMVEISPGVVEPLRGAEETMRAVRQDFYVPVSCYGCSNDIFCIADAKYVICPECRVVSPIEKGALDGQSLEQNGLGLGFSCESLFQMQSEILSER